MSDAVELTKHEQALCVAALEHTAADLARGADASHLFQGVDRDGFKEAAKQMLKLRSKIARMTR